MLEVAKQLTELYTKSLNILNRDSTDHLATAFVLNNMVSDNEESVSLTATTSHFNRSKKKCFFCGRALHTGVKSNCQN